MIGLLNLESRKTGKKIGTSAAGNVAAKRHKYLQLRDTLAVKMKQKKAETKLKPSNPYLSNESGRPIFKDSSTKRNLYAASTESVPTTKRVCMPEPTDAVKKTITNKSRDGLDLVEHLKTVSTEFVHPKSRLDRINGNIKANVPKGVLCTLCQNPPKQVSDWYCSLVYSHSL